MSAQERFAPQPASVREVRRFVAEAISGHPDEDDIIPAASELASEAIQHARTPFTVALTSSNDRLRLEVSDHSSTMPSPDGLDETHRGLRVIDAITRQWGIDRTETGKTIWVHFPRPPRTGF